MLDMKPARDKREEVLETSHTGWAVASANHNSPLLISVKDHNLPDAVKSMRKECRNNWCASFWNADFYKQ